MTCDTLKPQLSALLDGELAPAAIAEAESHLLDCPGCARSLADLAAVRKMADAWAVDAPDITGRVLSAALTDDQNLLLAEMRRLRAEMSGLRAEVAALSAQLARRADLPLWLPPAKPDYSRTENDPWTSTRS